MIAALRLLGITLANVLVIALILVALRSCSLQIKHQPFAHPLLESTWLVARAQNPRPQKALERVYSFWAEQFRGETAQPRNQGQLFYELDCKYIEGQWKVIAPFTASLEITLKRYAKQNQSHKRSQTKSQSLKGLLKNKKYILNVLSAAPGALPKLAELIKQTETVNDLVIKSPLALIVREMRKFAPQLVFVAHEKEWAKLSTLSALFIETAIEIKPDIFILDSDRVKFSKREITELRRRGKKVILKVSSDYLSQRPEHSDFKDWIY